MDVINVSEEVYEIFDLTGFTELMNVQTNAAPDKDKTMREIGIEGKEMIGRYAVGTYYRLDAETVVKDTPHKDCVQDAQSDFSSDCLNSTQAC